MLLFKMTEVKWNAKPPKKSIFLQLKKYIFNCFFKKSFLIKRKKSDNYLIFMQISNSNSKIVHYAKPLRNFQYSQKKSYKYILNVQNLLRFERKHKLYFS